MNFYLLLLFLFPACRPLSAAAPVVPLPTLPGLYSVGSISVEAIDHTRQDPYTPISQPRHLKISLFYSTSDTHHPAAADQFLGFPAGFLEQIQSRSFASTRLEELQNLPIILSSPGLGSSREAYQILLEGLASYGYFVVAIEHTYDAQIVEFPSGELVFGLPTINGDAEALDVRTKDTSFVINQLANSSFIQQVPGGATALEAVQADHRIIGGCNLDGPLSGSQQLATAGHDRFNDPAWTETWRHLTGWRAEIMLANSTHMTFLDDSAVFTEMGLISQLDPGGATYGTTYGIRTTVVEIAYLKVFFDFCFVGRRTR